MSLECSPISHCSLTTFSHIHTIADHFSWIHCSRISSTVLWYFLHLRCCGIFSSTLFCSDLLSSLCSRKLSCIHTLLECSHPHRIFQNVVFHSQCSGMFLSTSALSTSSILTALECLKCHLHTLFENGSQYARTSSVEEDVVAVLECSATFSLF